MYFKVVVLLFCIPSIAFGREVTISAIENSANSDISAIVMKEAYKRLNIDMKVLPLPGKAALIRANNGDTDGELFRIDNVDKKFTNLIKVPVPINLLEGVAFVTDEKVDVRQWQDLAKYKIGVRKGIQFTDRATQDYPRNVVDSNSQLFQMLNAKRLDVVVMARLNGLLSIVEMTDHNIVEITPAIEQYPLFHYINKKNSHLLQPLTDVLTQLNNEGFISSARSNYIKNIRGESK